MGKLKAGEVVNVEIFLAKPKLPELVGNALEVGKLRRVRLQKSCTTTTTRARAAQQQQLSQCLLLLEERCFEGK